MSQQPNRTTQQPNKIKLISNICKYQLCIYIIYLNFIHICLGDHLKVASIVKSLHEINSTKLLFLVQNHSVGSLRVAALPTLHRSTNHHHHHHHRLQSIFIHPSSSAIYAEAHTYVIRYSSVSNYQILA